MDYAKKVKSAIEACQKIDNTGFSILSADTDKVKSYVYSSTKLPEMRGASIILDELNQEGVKRIFLSNRLIEDCLLFNKGGSILALVPTSLECKIKSEIETLYLKKTHGLASISVVTESIAENQLWSEFQNIINRLANGLKLEKEQKRSFPVYEVIPFARRCQSCGIRPANVKREKPETEYLCKSCDYKRSEGEYKPGYEDSGKTRFVREFLQSLTEEKKEQLMDSCLKKGAVLKSILDIGTAKDLSKIADEEDGYIGVIYADGNEIGAKIENLTTPEAFVEFSEKLYEITKNSLYSALENYIYPKTPDNRCILPFEIICIGGDDIFLILPANVALQVANRFCMNFEKQAQDSGVCQLKDATMSVGVVIAKENFPIYYIYDLVNQLLKNAKKKAKSNPKDIKTAVDFMVFKSQGGEVSDISEYRSQILTARSEFGGAEQRLEFTFRPYFREDFEKLLRFVKRLNDSKFPRSKLYAIRESLELGRENSTLQYLYIMSKSSEAEKKLLQCDLPSDFLSNGPSHVPWDKKDVELYPGYKTSIKYSEYRTPIVDIIEILDFVNTTTKVP